MTYDEMALREVIAAASPVGARIDGLPGPAGASAHFTVESPEAPDLVVHVMGQDSGTDVTFGAVGHCAWGGPLSAHRPELARLLRALMRGQYEETQDVRGDRVLAAKGRLRLDDGRLEEFGFLLPRWLSPGGRRTLRYGR